MNKVLSFIMVVCLSFNALADGGTFNEYLGSGTPVEAAKLAGETRGAGLTAAGNSSQANAYGIVNSINMFTTVTTGSADSARLPTKGVVARDDILVVNNGTGVLQVYPPTGGTINRLSANAGLAVGSGGAVVFKRTSATGWGAYGASVANLVVSGTTTISNTIVSTSNAQATMANSATSGILTLAGGTDFNASTGGVIALYGNAAAGTPGDITLNSGTTGSSGVTIVSNTAGGSVTLRHNGVNALVARDVSSVFPGTITSTGTATLGWAVVAGANTACTTTCTAPCVFGVNTAATEADIVACSDATADECLCAGAS